MSLRHLRVVVTIAGLLLLSGLPRAAEQGTVGVAVMRDVMVAMRDGVRLATDIYLPTRDGVVVADRLPTVLERTPYNKTGSEREGRVLCRARLHVCVAGHARPLSVGRRLADDGRRRPRRRGSVRVDRPAAVVERKHRHDRHVLRRRHAARHRDGEGAESEDRDPRRRHVEHGYQSMRNGGAFELRWFNWIVAMGAPQGSHEARDPAKAAALAEMAENKRAYLQQLPIRRGTTPLQIAPEYEDWLVDAIGHGTNDDFCAQNNIVDHPDRYKDMPVYLVGGWYDSWAGNTSRQLPGPEQGHQGPGLSDHGSVDSRPAGNVGTRPGQLRDGRGDPRPARVAARVVRSLAQRRDNAVGRAAPFATPVRIFVMGTGDG